MVMGGMKPMPIVTKIALTLWKTRILVLTMKKLRMVTETLNGIPDQICKRLRVRLLDEKMSDEWEIILKTTTVVKTPETEEKFGIEGTFNLYSVGMKENHSLPDLEMRGVPGMLLNAGIKTINEINAYRLVSDKPVLINQHISWEHGSIRTEQGDDWDGHYSWKAEDMIRLTSAVTDVTHECECCQFDNAGVTE